MIHPVPLILIALAAPHAAARAQNPPPTVEATQAGIDWFFGRGMAIDTVETLDDGKRTWLVSRKLGTSKTVARCETEFTAASVGIVANAKATRTFRIRWGRIARIENEDFAVTAIGKPGTPDVRFSVQDADLRAQLAYAFDFLRGNCPG